MKVNLKKNLEQLETIATWFDSQDQVDLDLALEKVKTAAILIKESKERFAQITNEFEEIKRTVESDT